MWLVKNKFSAFLITFLGLWMTIACNVAASSLPSTATFAPVPLASPTLAPSLTAVPMGIIQGSVNYPSEYIPPQRVVAFDVSNPGKYFYVDTAGNQATFEIPVPPGTYYVVSYLLDGSMAAGYSQAVLCGLRVDCDDHSLIPVPVAAGETVSGITPFDWYAPPGAFPPLP
jgi:hypothetical protein